MNWAILKTRRLGLTIPLLLLFCQAVSATEQEEMQARVQACAGCHAYSDAENQPYAPSIDGKPVDYLYQQLLNFREGRRSNKIMTRMLAHLSSEYLYSIAEYYAQRPTDEGQKITSNATLSDEDTVTGQMLAQRGTLDVPACITCHGGDLRGDGVAIPSLRGLSAAYIVAQLGAWQAGTRHARKPDCMAEVSQQLSSRQIETVAYWISTAPKAAHSLSPRKKELPLPCGAVQ